MVCACMQVYGRIKEAMELAEEARLDRDAALVAQEALQQEVAALQVGNDRCVLAP